MPQKHRIVITTEGLSWEQVSELGEYMSQLSGARKVQVQNLDQRRTLRYALVLGLTIAFWVALVSAGLWLWRATR